MKDGTSSQVIDKKLHTFTGIIAYPTILLFLSLILGYITLFILFTTGSISGWFCALFGAALAYGMFTIAHEASHGNIAGGHTSFLKLESALGWLSTFFLFFPFSAFVVIHLRHHAHTNDPQHDPDGYVKGSNWLSNFFRCVTLIGHYYVESLGKKAQINPVMKRTKRASMLFLLLQFLFMALMVLSGFGLAYLFVMLIPALIAAPFLGFTFDWLPHYPHHNIDKYHNTRIVTVPGLEWLSLFQSYHLIHHLYPRVPFYKYKQKFQAIETFLREKKSPIEGFGHKDAPLLKTQNTYADLLNGDTFHYALEVHEVRALTHDSAVITFQNFMNIPFQFKAGQYVVLSMNVDHEKINRCYSICSNPNDGKLSVGVKRVKQGKLSNALLDNLKQGSSISVSGPFGNFQLQHTDRNIPHTFIAGGSGITPILAMLTQALDAGYNDLYLLYGCRSEQDVMFKDELLALANQFPTRFSLNLSYKLLHNELQEKLLANRMATGFYYLCGPHPMMEASQIALKRLGVESSRIISEDFAPNTNELSGAVHQVRVGGFSYEAYSSETILEASLRHKKPLPYACGMGQCGTCKIMLEAGNVRWKQEDQTALLAHEIEQGYILTCMCKANSAVKLKI